MNDDLVKRLTIKAGVMEMGERIAWGSDTALMREAADRIEELEHILGRERKAHEKELYVWQDNYAALEAKLEKADALAAECENVFDYVDGTGPQEFYLALYEYTDTRAETQTEIKENDT